MADRSDENNKLAGQGDATHGEKVHHEESRSLGLAGGMAKSFIHSPLTPLFLIASLAAGIMGLIFTPRQEDPQISVPMVDIFFQYPGASATQVASLATDPLERMMSEIKGVKHVYSATQRGGGMVTVQFEVGEEMTPSLVKLYDKLESNKDKIPPGVIGPLVKPKGVDDVPVVTLTLWSNEVDDAGLRRVALEVMQRLKEVPNTSQSFIVGGRSEEMRVEVKPERLTGFGLTMGQIAQTLKAANSRHQAGTAEAQGKYVSVYTGSFLRHAEDLRRLIVGVYQGRPVYLREVADVIEGPGDAKNVVQYFTGPQYALKYLKMLQDRPEAEKARLPAPVRKLLEEGLPADPKDIPQEVLKHIPSAKNGAPAVTVAIAKKPGSNGVSVAEGVLAQVEALKNNTIPDNVHVEITRNYGETANDKVNELILKLFVATGAVTLLILIALGWRASVVVAVVIPIVILMTVFFAWLMGFTIDRVSLFALIFSIGILVDDAIVVVENIYRRWLIEEDVRTETTVDAVREVGNPTILATFTVIAALLPMGFVSGMMGPYMAPIPALGSVAMILSLFAAFIFTPWLAYRIRPSLMELHKAHDSEQWQIGVVSKIYNRILVPFLDNARKARLLRISIWGAFLLSCLLFYTTSVSVKMLPLDNKPEFNVVINMPTGTALAETANLTQKLSEKLMEIPEVTALQSYVGTASPFDFNGLVRHYYLRDKPWQANIQVQLLKKGERERSSHELALLARKLLQPIAKSGGARSLEVVEMPPGPPVLQTMVAEVYGPDAETRRKVAQDLTEIFRKAENITDVDNYIQDPHTVWHFEIDDQKALLRGVSKEAINQQLAMAMGGYKVGTVKGRYELEPRNIVLQFPLSIRSDLARLGELPIPARNGTSVPLAELGRFVQEQQDPVIYHKDLRPVEYVTGEMTGRLAAPIYGMLEVSRLLKDYKTPEGVELSGHLVGPPENSHVSSFEWTGEWTVTYETFRDMGVAFAAAMVLIYMLVVWEFGNFRIPGIIMAPIPLTLIGIIPGHWLLGAEFTATSMIGFIALAGIIVRNSILLVDFSREGIAEGKNVREAVLDAVITRTRPIMITALALLAGSSVILTDPIFNGMAISLMFGGMVSTLLTLIVIPLASVRAATALIGDIKVDQSQLPQTVRGDAAAVQSVADVAPAKPKGRLATALENAWLMAKAIPAFAGLFLAEIFGKLFAKPKAWLSNAWLMAKAMPSFAWMLIQELWANRKARKAEADTPQASEAAKPANKTPQTGSDGGGTGGARENSGHGDSGKSGEESAKSEKRAPKKRPGSGGDEIPPIAAHEPQPPETQASALVPPLAAVSQTDPAEPPIPVVQRAIAALETAENEPGDSRRGREKISTPKENEEKIWKNDKIIKENTYDNEENSLNLENKTSNNSDRYGISSQDDLTVIRGIGEMRAELLREKGFRTFEAIANLTQEQIDALNEAFGFDHLIERERWVEQARELIKKRRH